MRAPGHAPGRQPQLLEPELEHVREAARALGERRGLQQRLLVERLDVEVLGEEVDEGLVVDAAARQVTTASRYGWRSSSRTIVYSRSPRSTMLKRPSGSSSTCTISPTVPVAKMGGRPEYSCCHSPRRSAMPMRRAPRAASRTMAR